MFGTEASVQRDATVVLDGLSRSDRRRINLWNSKYLREEVWFPASRLGMTAPDDLPSIAMTPNLSFWRLPEKRLVERSKQT
ncbi:hypothetical protein Poly59_12970 [Rubripirellula reticaptiva]|uniref:Uncharacterized protein n=1 Tax=Rubripirellula reticaptiva TaxID=2528013 RepID=A0A5C6FE62_9BACT|nr:hypothetical protein Poly59_12970 [Rubripirellula reticaptiva]